MSNPYDKPQGPKYKQVTVTVDPEVWRQLTERNKNMSAICRDALAAELQRCLALERSSEPMARRLAAEQPVPTRRGVRVRR
jgi:hypothetical protein